MVTGDPPAGFVCVELVDGVPHIWQLAVHPDCGRRGLGRALVEAACRRARAEGFAAITLTTFRDVHWNGPFYRSLGFIPTDDLTPGLAAIRAHERTIGDDDFGPRVAMRLALEPARCGHPQPASPSTARNSHGGCAELMLLSCQSLEDERLVFCVRRSSRERRVGGTLGCAADSRWFSSRPGSRGGESQAPQRRCKRARPGWSATNSNWTTHGGPGRPRLQRRPRRGTDSNSLKPTGKETGRLTASWPAISPDAWISIWNRQQ